MSKEASRLLMVFAKNPRKGKVKTRLAKDLGEDKALEIYQRLLEKTRITALSVKCSKELWYSDFVDEHDEWPYVFFTKKLQQGTDLGERMKHAFQQAFKNGFGRVVIIGSDCPELKSGMVEVAFGKLDEFDVVLGPANDGGYYLLGMSSFCNLFDDIAWSTSNVLEKSIEKIRKLDLKYFKLPQLTDLDTTEDLKKIPSL